MKINIFKFVRLLLAAGVLMGSATATIPAHAAAPSRQNNIARAKPAHIPFQCVETDGSTQIMIDVDSSFAYKTNSWRQPIARLIKFQCYKVLGRDNGEFLLFEYGDSNVWISHTAVRLRTGLDWQTLPVLDVAKTSTLAKPVPVLTVGVSAAMKKLYANAAKVGRNPQIATVMGDCNSEHPVYFGRLFSGATNLALNPKLGKTMQYFAPSFTRTSVATQGSFTSDMPFDPSWANPKLCNRGEGLLECELNTSKASVIFIGLGTGDTFTWQNFEANLRRAVDTTLRLNVVPVLVTKADFLEWHQGGASAGYINNIVRNVGAQYGVPVIDLAAVAKNLPNSGLMEEHDANAQQTEAFHLNQQGMDAKIVMTLQVLNTLSGK